jgi:hypothetical protein
MLSKADLTTGIREKNWEREGEREREKERERERKREREREGTKNDSSVLLICS